MEMQYIIQIIGLVGFVVGVLAFNYKEDNKMKIAMGFSSLLLTIHFLLMEAFVLGALKLINTFRNFITIKYSSSILLFIFLIIYWITGFIFSEIWIDWLPIITITISTIAIRYIFKNCLYTSKFGLDINVSLYRFNRWFFIRIHNFLCKLKNNLSNVSY